jgi:protein-S-isoprenylcysteine O-methyltransferase Ste14
MRANVITLVVIVGMVVWLAMHAYLVEWDGVKLAGAAVAGMSVALLVVARVQLGGSFSVKAKAKKLVTTGLYAKIRNPIYVFSAMFLVGMVMVLERWLLLVPIMVLVPVQIVRARKEEAVLEAAFGDEYVRYKAGTWF